MIVYSIKPYVSRTQDFKPILMSPWVEKWSGYTFHRLRTETQKRSMRSWHFHKVVAEVNIPVNNISIMSKHSLWIYKIQSTLFTPSFDITTKLITSTIEWIKSLAQDKKIKTDIQEYCIPRNMLWRSVRITFMRQFWQIFTMYVLWVYKKKQNALITYHP